MIYVTLYCQYQLPVNYLCVMSVSYLISLTELQNLIDHDMFHIWSVTIDMEFLGIVICKIQLQHPVFEAILHLENII